MGLGERPTVNGTRPQSHLHPLGNKGADIIEIIRLEKLAANPKLFVKPHPAVEPPRPRTRAQSAGPARPWSEPRWTRPQSASNVRVHAADKLYEVLHGVDEADPQLTSQQPSRVPSPLPKSSCHAGSSSASGTAIAAATAASLGGAKRRPQSAYTAAEARARQRLREQHEAMQEAVARKLKETQAAAAVAQEEEFTRAWEQFHAEQAGPVADIEEFLRLKDIEGVRRANAHCKYWNEEVFDKIQAQVQLGLRKRESKGTYNTRWRHAQDDYLRATKKKEAGIFRDIIIEDEYDPLEHASKNIKYHSREVSLKDPLKLELTKHELEAAMVPGSKAYQAAKVAKQHLAKGGRTAELPVTMWSKMDATPYGHFNKVMTRDVTKERKPPYSTTGLRVLGDHYTGL